MNAGGREPASAAPMLRFRPMAMRDLEAVLRNETRAYAFPWTPGHFADSIAGPDLCRIALEGDRVVGHGIVSHGVGEAHVLNLCVERDRQGRGYGRALLEHVLDAVQKLGVTVVFLEVRASNQPALALYESVGFRDIGRRRDYYPAALGREDARVMALQMAPTPATGQAAAPRL